MVITDIKQQKHNKNMYSVFVDSKYCFSIQDIDLAKLKLTIGQKITKQEIKYYKQNYEYARAKEKALKYISCKIRTISEVKQKLLNLGYSKDIIDKVIDNLIDLKYINDEEYVDLYIKEKQKLRPCGKKLLKYELKNKGIDDKIIEQKFDEVDLDEYSIAFDLAKKKLSKIDTLNKKELQKLYSFLLRKGFTSSIALKVLKDIQK